MKKSIFSLISKKWVMLPYAFCTLLCWIVSVALSFTPLIAQDYEDGEEEETGITSQQAAALYTAMQQKTTSFYDIAASAQTYIAQNPTDQAFARKFSRWRKFWGNRVGQNGNFNTYGQYMAALSNPANICNTGGNWQQLGPIINASQNSGYVRCVYAPPGQPLIDISTIFAGSNTAGLWKTSNGGVNWQNLTDQLRLPALGVNAILAQPNASNPSSPTTLYIGTGNSVGFFENYGMGVFKSTDGGTTWQSTTLDYTVAQGQVIEKLFFDETDPTYQTIYALGSTKLWKTTNAGSTWQLVLGGDPPSIVFEWDETISGVEIVPGMANTLVLATKRNNWPYIAKIYKTTNSGANWTNISPNATSFPSPNPPALPYYYATTAFHIDATNAAPGKIFAMYEDYQTITDANGNTANEILTGYKPYISLNLADPTATWQVIVSTVGTDVGYYGAGFEISDADATVVYSGKLCLQKSADSGLTFSPFISTSATTCPDQSNQHADLRGFQIYTANAGGANDVILTGTDGGIGKSTNGGSTWTRLNGDIILTQFYDIANSSAKPGLVVGGAQDNHNYLGQMQTDGNWAWSLYGGGDGGHCIIDANNPLIIYGRTNENLFKATPTINASGYLNTPLSTTTIDTYAPPGSNPYEHFIMVPKPEQSNLLYYAKDNAFRIVDGNGTNPTYNVNMASGQSITYNSATCPIISFNARALSTAPSDGNTLYLAGDVTFDTDPNPAVQVLKYEYSVVFKSINGGSSWIPLSPTSLIYGRINAITVDPRNPDVLYLAHGGFGADAGGATNNRVSKSTDGGLNWADISINNGLTPFPVNALVYEKGSNGILYAGTDAGVYRYNPTTQQWTCFNHNLPTCIVSDLEIDYCKRLLQIGTFGRGIWQTALDNNDFSTDNEINTNTIYPIATVINSAHTIRVKAPNILTVNGTLNMQANTFIIIETGAKLVVNGTITNACGDMWGGIRVLGNKDLGQFNTASQGKVDLNTGSRIEYARDAISTWDGASTNTTGGIIVANGATFSNNRRDIEFMKYSNVVDGIAHENLSSFNNCTFSIDNSYRSNAPTHRVTMWDVNGISFKKCTFINNNTTLSDAQQNFCGIYSIDAGYKVGGNTAAWDACSFQKLSGGINATRAAGTYVVRVKNCTFTANAVGIVTQNLYSPIILNNSFTVHNPARGNIGIGVIIYTGTGYQIQNNIFTGNSLPTKTEWGIWLHNTGPTENLIYRNTFTKLDFGNVILGDNKNTDNDDPMGLHYECNTNTGGQYDMYITGGNGIRLFQNGTDGATQSAENKYSRNGTPESDYYLHSGNPVTQYYNNTVLTTQALDYTTAWFTQLEGLANTCPDNSTQYMGLAAPTRQVLANSFTQYETDYGNTLYLYNALIDNGNTNALLNNIDLEWSDDAWTLRNQLVAKSPNLSQTVLRRAALTGTLPDAMLIEILLLNADACKDKLFLDFLAHDIPNPLPQNLLDLLLCTQEPGSLKKTLYRNLLNYRSLMLYNGQLLVSNILTDSLPNTTELHQYLERQHSSAADYTLAESYLAHNNAAAGTTLLADMPNRYLYVLRHPTEHAAYQQLYALKRQLAESGRNYLQLSNAEKSQLQTLANGTPASEAAVQAQNILCFVGGGNCALPTIPTLTPTPGSGKLLSSDPTADINKLLTNITVYPNPANDYLTFAYNIPSQALSTATLSIADVSGKEIAHLSFKDLSGELLWDTRTIPEGLYYYTVVFGTEQLASGSLSIVHK